MSERVDILVNPKKRFYCDDYGERKGCGQEIKLIRTTNGKTIACNPVQMPCLDREGNTVWVFVPHWITCPEQGDYRVSFMQDKADQNAEWAKKNANSGDDFEGGENSRSRRSGARRATA